MKMLFEDAVYICSSNKFLLRPTKTVTQTEFVDVKTALKRLANSRTADIAFLLKQEWEIAENTRN